MVIRDCREISWLSTYNSTVNLILLKWFGRGRKRIIAPHARTNIMISKPVTFDELMPISFVGKAFDHCLRFMHGYRSGLVGPVVKNTRAIVASLLL